MSPNQIQPRTDNLPIACLMASSRRPGWKWDRCEWAMKHGELGLTVHPLQLVELEIESHHDLHVALFGFEIQAMAGGEVTFTASLAEIRKDLQGQRKAG